MKPGTDCSENWSTKCFRQVSPHRLYETPKPITIVMPMQDTESLFRDLTNHVARLEDAFIKGFLAVSTAKPEDYDLSVRAYCVLTHAALEEYLEGIALYVMKQSIDDYVLRKTVRDSLLTLTAYGRLELKVNEDETTDEIRTFDVLRPMLDEAKTRFSRSVHKN